MLTALLGASGQAGAGFFKASSPHGDKDGVDAGEGGWPSVATAGSARASLPPFLNRCLSMVACMSKRGDRLCDGEILRINLIIIA
jgi:hypothetical protein